MNKEVMLPHGLISQDFPVNYCSLGSFTHPGYSLVALNVQRVVYRVVSVEQLCLGSVGIGTSSVLSVCLDIVAF